MLLRQDVFTHAVCPSETTPEVETEDVATPVNVRIGTRIRGDCLRHFFVPKPPPYSPPPDYPPMVDVDRDPCISREKAIEAAKQLVAKYEQLELGAKVDIAVAAKDAFAPSSVLPVLEMSEDDPAYTTAPADFSTCDDARRHRSTLAHALSRHYAAFETECTICCAVTPPLPHRWHNSHCVVSASQNN